MISRSEIEERESKTLVPYAVWSGKSRGRRHREREDNWRTAFQRDRDRILHSTAFRRLQYKTQVFVNDEGDHYRTRLTHTLEVAQIARSIARTLALNEDLTETLALAHDLGHGPFGHAGQDALAKLMARHGGFNHNLQVLRIVEELEESYPSFRGLNLTFEVLEGLKKHSESQFFPLEAQVVDLADEIAYNSHDMDDGIRSGLLKERDLLKLPLWGEVMKKVTAEFGKKINNLQRRRMGIRFLVHLQVRDIVNATQGRIRAKKIRTLKDALKNRHLVRFSPPFEKKIHALKIFLMRKLYQHPNVVAISDRGKEFISGLFRCFLEKPKELPPYVRGRVARHGLERTVCDYIAGMTDRFAEQEYLRLCTDEDQE
jgi:dGTPase